MIAVNIVEYISGLKIKRAIIVKKTISEAVHPFISIEGLFALLI